MWKLLANVQETQGGFRGYIPCLPGCEACGATVEEVEVNLTAAVRKHLADHSENGVKPDEVEVIIAVEAPRPPRPSDERLAAIYDESWRPLTQEDLEFFLHLDEQQWVSFEEVMSELGLDAAEQTPGEAPE
jgi:predicted RNase H-like HicB family nuclease